MSDDHHFETANAGSSHTFPMQAGSLKKGGHCLLKGNPCKIMEIAVSKTGNHGHAKANITGIDIFTNKKYEDMCPTSHNMEVPNVARVEYTLLDVDEENGAVSVLTESGEPKDDLNLPTGPDGGREEICQELIDKFNDGKNLIVTVMCAMGKEKIVAYKESN